MSDELNELRARVTALEERVTMESGLRASVDRDLSGIAVTQRAQHHLLQALAITQGEHGEMIRDTQETVGQMRNEHGAMLSNIVSMLSRLIDPNQEES